MFGGSKQAEHGVMNMLNRNKLKENHRSLKASLAPWLLLGFSLVVCVAIGEIFLRMFPNLLRADLREQLSLKDENNSFIGNVYVGDTLRPNATGVLTPDGFKVTY